jgi:hypothetical protein
MLMHDQDVLRAMAKQAAAMAKAAEGGGSPTKHLEAEHKRLTAELGAVELLISLDRTRYQLEAMLRAPKSKVSA